VNLVGDLNLLVALQALLEERNVTKAGGRIGMGQPAMSAALARLRRHATQHTFDDELLLRVGRRYELTPLAQQLLPLVQETVELAERTFTAGQGFRPEPGGRTFTVTMSDCALASLGDPLIKAVRRQGHDVHLDVEVLPADVDASTLRVLALRRDLLVLPLGHQVPGRAQRLCTDDIVRVGDAGNPRLDDDKVSLDTLAALPHAVSPLHLHIMVIFSPFVADEQHPAISRLSSHSIAACGRSPRPNGPVLTPHWGGHVIPSAVATSRPPAGARSDPRTRQLQATRVLTHRRLPAPKPALSRPGRSH
jgi:DNA-binding transcriptional LysR family regulator